MKSEEERRIELANKCAQLIESHYQEAITRTSADDIVIYVLDCDDAAANAIARKFFGDASVDEMIANTRQRSGRPIKIADGPYKSASSAIQAAFPDVTIPPPTRDSITFVVVSDGGILAGVMQTESRADDSYPDIETIVASATGTIRHTYAEAISDGKKDPVVFLLDCKDSIGGDFARRFIPSKIVDQQVAASSPGRPVPVCMAFPYARACQLLRDSFTGLQPEEFPPIQQGSVSWPLQIRRIGLVLSRDRWSRGQPER